MLIYVAACVLLVSPIAFGVSRLIEYRSARTPRIGMADTVMVSAEPTYLSSAGWRQDKPGRVLRINERELLPKGTALKVGFTIHDKVAVRVTLDGVTAYGLVPVSDIEKSVPSSYWEYLKSERGVGTIIAVYGVIAILLVPLLIGACHVSTEARDVVRRPLTDWERAVRRRNHIMDYLERQEARWRAMERSDRW